MRLRKIYPKYSLNNNNNYSNHPNRMIIGDEVIFLNNSFKKENNKIALKVSKKLIIVFSFSIFLTCIILIMIMTYNKESHTLFSKTPFVM